MSLFHKMVSGRRKRYQDATFDLDLTYITPQIIAMGLPSEGIEAAYRNPIDKVSRYFDEKHGDGTFLIINLSERTYDYNKFKNQVMESGFPDHSAPPLKMIWELCHVIHQWLRSSPQQVVALHCKAGKGRTGLVVACYLMFSGHFANIMNPNTRAAAALGFFLHRRGEGVTYNAQKRHAIYFAETLRRLSPDLTFDAKTNNLPLPHPFPLILRKITVKGLPKYATRKNDGTVAVGFARNRTKGSGNSPGGDVGICIPVIHVMNFSSDPKEDQEIIYNSAWDHGIEGFPSGPNSVFNVDMNVALCGDINIVFYHRGVSTPMFSITLHTSMSMLSSHKLSFTPKANASLTVDLLVAPTPVIARPIRSASLEYASCSSLLSQDAQSESDSSIASHATTTTTKATLSEPRVTEELTGTVSNKSDSQSVIATSNTPDSEVSPSSNQSEGLPSPGSPSAKGFLCPQCIKRFPSTQALATHVCTAAQLHSARSVWRERVQAFYQFHNPVKLQDDGFVDEVLQYYVGWEEELMAKLVSQYGPEPNMEARIEKKRAPPALDGSGPNPSDEQYASAAASPDGGAKRKTGPTHDPDNVEENRTAQAVSSSAVAPPLPSALPSQLAMETAQSNTTAAPTPPLRRNRSARIKSNLSTRGTTHLLQYDLEDIDIYQRDHNMQVTLKRYPERLSVVLELSRGIRSRRMSDKIAPPATKGAATTASTTPRTSFSAPANEKPMAGFLEKRGGFNIAWKKRWCVVRKGVLRYFKTKATSEPAGEVELASVAEVTSKLQQPREFRLMPKKGLCTYRTQKRVYHMRASTAVEALKWVRSLRKDLEIAREKEKAQESLRLAADKFNAFVALTDRFYDYWQDASQHQTRLKQFFSILDEAKVPEILVMLRGHYTAYGDGNIGIAYRQLVMDLGHTYDHKVYLPDPVRDSLAC